MNKKKPGIIIGILLIVIIIILYVGNKALDDSGNETEVDQNREFDSEYVLYESTLSKPSFEDVSVHDPSIIKVDDMYYVFGTHIEAARSKDLISWERFTNGYSTPNNVLYGDLSENLSESFEWAGENDADSYGGYAVWAPEIIWNPHYVNVDGTVGAYMMHYSASSTYMRSAIGFAVSKDIEGPYTYVDTILYSGFTEEEAYDDRSEVNKKWNNTNLDTLIDTGEIGEVNPNWFTNEGGYNNRDYPNAIDANLFFSTDDRLYMTYGSWSGGIFSLEIDRATGKVIYPGEDDQTEDGRMIDRYFGTKISGGFYESGEGPYVEYNPDTNYYYLYVTYGWLESDGAYHMRQFRSKEPEGPYVDAAGNPAVLPPNTSNSQFGNKLMGNFIFKRELGEPGFGPGQGYMSPGHNSVYTDAESGDMFLVFHTRFPNQGEGHAVRTHQMFMNKNDWPVVSPKRYAGERLNEEFSNEEIAGTYKFINHGKDNSTELKSSHLIYLHSDGSITGDTEGRWESDGYYATITINEIDYEGVFIEVWDESIGSGVISFTALSDRGVSIWGVQSLSGDQADEDIVAEVERGLSLGNPNNVTNDLELITEAFAGTSISWESSDEEIIDTDGSVRRPSDTDQVVRLTATITLRDVTIKKTFDMTVLMRQETALSAHYPLDGNLTDVYGDMPEVKVTGMRIDDIGGEPSFGEGRDGQAFHFDGEKGLRLPNGLIDSSRYSVTFYTYPTAHHEHSTLFFGARNPDQWVSVVPYGHTGQTMVWSGSESWYDGPAPNRIELNEWHHLALVVDGEHLAFYINGELAYEGLGFNDYFSNGDAYFGLGVNHWDVPFEGYISDFKVYKGALAQNEIEDLI